MVVPEGLKCFTTDVYLLILSPQDLRAPSANRRETLPCDQYLAEFYNANPKIWGPSLKNFTLGEIWVHFT